MKRTREYNISGDNTNYTLQEVADELGVTTTRVRKIEKQAMRNFIRNAIKLRLYESISELASMDGKKTIFDKEHKED